ncbi:helix-turn-helix transcriptional regulator [Streptomyces sp. NPDC058202]|uniref:helix-turn-helix domain-containing protein n=1 Tax=Streptomyces sp. NPDC058202 TaxID=3346380 RepID=UPI0036E1F2B5
MAERLMVSQPKISHLENGNRTVSPRDVRDLCALYGVTDQQVIDTLLAMARESGQHGWWHAYGDIPQSVYIALETDAASLHTYAPVLIPDLLQTPAYAHAVIGETIPELTAEQAATRLKVRLHRQHRIYDPAHPLRLSVVLDESVLHRVVGSPEIMREQLEHLTALGAESHITVQVLPAQALTSSSGASRSATERTPTHNTGRPTPHHPHIVMGPARSDPTGPVPARPDGRLRAEATVRKPAPLRPHERRGVFSCPGSWPRPEGGRVLAVRPRLRPP